MHKTGTTRRQHQVSIHEAYQFLIAKKKKKSMRSMTENWGKIGGKALVLNVNNISSSQTQEMEKQEV